MDSIVLVLSASQQRDVRELAAERQRFLDAEKQTALRMLSICRTVIGSSGHDPDALAAAGWTVDFTPDGAQVVMTPPAPTVPALALVPDTPPMLNETLNAETGS